MIDAALAFTASLAERWSAFVERGLCEGSLALAVLFAAWWPVRRRLPARLACLLFLVPLCRLAFPFALPLPAWLSPWSLLAPEAPEPAVLLAVGPVGLPDGPAAAAPGSAVAQVLCVLWLLGVAVLAVRFARAQVQTKRAVRAAVPVAPGSLPLDLHALRARAGVVRRVRWLVSPHVATPAAGGILRPYVLLPVGFADRLPPRQLAFVLLHELAHVRRCDVAIALLQRVVQIVWFFHPAVWLASRLIDQQRELACDQEAMQRSGATRRECGEAFLSVAAWVHGRATVPAATLAMFESTSVLRRRLMHILTETPAPSRWLAAAYLAAAFAVAVPVARAEAPAVELVALAQDDGDRAEVERLRRQIAELKKQHAELARQLAKLSGREGAKGEADDAAPARAKARRRPRSGTTAPSPCGCATSMTLTPTTAPSPCA